MGASGYAEAEQFLREEILDLPDPPRTPSFTGLGFLLGETFWRREEKKLLRVWVLTTAQFQDKTKQIPGPMSSEKLPASSSATASMCRSL